MESYFIIIRLPFACICWSGSVHGTEYVMRNVMIIIMYVLSGRMRALYSNVQDSAYPLFRYSNRPELGQHDGLVSTGLSDYRKICPFTDSPWQPIKKLCNHTRWSLIGDALQDSSRGFAFARQSIIYTRPVALWGDKPNSTAGEFTAFEKPVGNLIQLKSI